MVGDERCPGGQGEATCTEQRAQCGEAEEGDGGSCDRERGEETEAFEGREGEAEGGEEE